MAGFILSGASLASPGPSTTPAVNTRSRLEGLPLSADLQPALSAEVADPLWLLCRQWQFLEFAGEDAGTPIDVRVEGERAQLSRYLAGSLDADSTTRAHDYSGRRPRARDGGRGRAGPRPSRPAGRRGRGPAAVDAQRRPAERPVRGGLPLRPGRRRRGGPHRRRVAGPGRHPQHRRPRRCSPRSRRCGTPAATLTGLPPEPVVPAELQDQALERLDRWLALVRDGAWSTRASPRPGTRPARSTPSRSPRRRRPARSR